ncbi:glutamine synthetase [candidate division KSB1 bacterium]|nr:glutamine synthetase [candidate division KSB1 bacterium]
MEAKIEKIRETIKKQDLKFLYLLFTDIAGVSKKVTIKIDEFENAIRHGIWFDGSSIEGFTRIFESDMLLIPDIDTFSVLPWSFDSGNAAQIICDIYTPDEQPFPGDPRGVLKKAMQKAKDLGFHYLVGPEIEFFLLDRTQEPDLVPHDNKGYFDLAIQSRAVKICQSTISSLKAMHITCESYHHEVSAGQHEIDLHYDDAVKIADSVITFKHALKTHASGTDLRVTFMPKPIFGINGSGMHVHQSFSDAAGKNAFHNETDAYGLSDVAYQFLAGQLKHAQALAAIVDPTVNSYKRLVPGFEAPVYICWGRVNRSALIRVPKVTKSRRAVGTRLELRCPDPSANPYLAFTAMLSAGLDGVRNKMKPPKAVEENVYDFDDKKLSELNISTLPTNLHEAVKALEDSSVLTGALGSHITEYFVRAKTEEWAQFLMQVTQWERERYL